VTVRYAVSAAPRPRARSKLPKYSSPLYLRNGLTTAECCPVLAPENGWMAPDQAWADSVDVVFSSTS
jgi:hypothetical protein